MKKKQQGFFSLVIIMLLLLMGAVATSAVNLFVTQNFITGNSIASMKAAYIAEAGLERGATNLLTGTLSSRTTCTGMSSTPVTVGTAPNTGTFSITSPTVYYATSTTLSGAVTSSATTIPVASVASYAPTGTGGRLWIDRELIDYTEISGNSFINVRRGVAGTTASSHVSGARVAQYQCNYTSTGYVPNSSSPLGSRQLTQGMQEQELWLVGNTASSNTVLKRWNRTTEATWNNENQTAPAGNPNALGMDMLNNADGWIVGETATGPAYFIYRYNPATQNFAAAAIQGSPPTNRERNLYSVSAVSTNEAWAVGLRSSDAGANRRFTVLKWDGTDWCLVGRSGDVAGYNCGGSLLIPGTTGRDMYGVMVIDTDGNGIGNLGFAVGESGYNLEYNGTTWSAGTTFGAGNNMNAVFIVSASEAWAVGNSNTIYKWNGTAWVLQGSIPTPSQNLRAIDMIDTDGDGVANYGWTVGARGKIMYYNGSSWTNQTSGTGNQLNAVAIFSRNDVWAAGVGPTLLHYDGSTWSAVAAPPGTNSTYNSMGKIAVPRQFNSQTNWTMGTITTP